VGRTLVTGATGFVGAQVARRLVERGDDVRVLLRPQADEEALTGLDAETVRGDLLDRRAVRRALRGIERVFHTAGMASLEGGSEGEAAVFRANVDTARTVLEESQRADVERVVLTSSAAAVGPAPYGQTADEDQVFNAAGLGIPYVDAKREVEAEAFRFAARGLPVVCVNPTLVFGAGDRRAVATSLVWRFLLGEVSVYPDGAVNIVDVDDVARAHLLADSEGLSGERYLVGNRNYTLERLFTDLARLSGVEPPPLKLPAMLAVPFARAMEAVPGGSPISVPEAAVASRWWTYRSTKASRELGWEPSHHEDTLEATVDWCRRTDGAAIARARTSQPARYKAASAVLAVLQQGERLAGGVARRLGF